MVTRTVIANRVMKARHESMCPICQEPIRVGQLIARRGVWQHVGHVLDDIRQGITERETP